MYRLSSIGVVLLWLSAMVALIARDVWPAWTAQDPPPITAQRLAQIVDEQEQFGLLDTKGRQIGTAWSNVTATGPNTNIYGTMQVRELPLLSDILIETLTVFDGEGGLDSFELDVHGVPLTTIRVRGERRGIYFPCELQVGLLRREANLDLSASRMIGESLRPFTFLPALEVGQSWRMQVLDPLAAAMNQQTRFTPVIARVTRIETLELAGKGLIECFVVETSPHQAVAWVDRQGRVVQQQVEMPALGRVTVVQQPYDAGARQEAREQMNSRMRRIGSSR